MSTQKSLVIPALGAAFEVIERPVPKPQPGEVLVKIHAAGLNPVDAVNQKLGLFIKEYPAVIGMDCAGVVEEVGEGVTQFASTGYCYGGRTGFDLGFTNELKVVTMAHPSLLKPEEDLKVRTHCATSCTAASSPKRVADPSV